MAGWASRFGSWGGRFSPFGRSNSSGDGTQVTDSDFSYITAEDIAKSNNVQDALGFSDRHSNRPQDSDVIVLKHDHISYLTHFPAYSIDDGVLTMGEIRGAAAKSLRMPNHSSGSIQLFFKGTPLVDDSLPARDAGLQSGSESEVLVLATKSPSAPESVSDEGDTTLTIPGKSQTKTHRRRRRGKKTKAASTERPTRSPPPKLPPIAVRHDSTHMPGLNSRPVIVPSPRLEALQMPIQKLDAIASVFQSDLLPQCRKFRASPPLEQDRRVTHHKRLTETILTQILLKLDAVETGGDDAARQKRKSLVKEVQEELSALDEIVQGSSR